MSTVQSGNTELLVARTDVVATLEAMEKQPLTLEPQEDCVLNFKANLKELLDLLNNADMVIDRGKSTCAATTTAEGSGLSLAIPNREVSFTITARDGQGCLRSVGGDLFLVELTQNKEVEFKCIVEDRSNGTYVVTYTSPADSKGNLRLSVLLRGSHIKGSPFSVNVTDAPIGKISCDSCGKRTKSMIYYFNLKKMYFALCFPDCDRIILKHWSWTKCCGPC